MLGMPARKHRFRLHRAFRKSPIEEIEADIKEMPRRFSPTYGNSPTEATRRICAATAK
jgi:hypothetical protein